MRASSSAISIALGSGNGTADIYVDNFKLDGVTMDFTAELTRIILPIARWGGGPCEAWWRGNWRRPEQLACEPLA